MRKAVQRAALEHADERRLDVEAQRHRQEVERRAVKRRMVVPLAAVEVRPGHHVQTDRHVQVLRRGPERVVGRVAVRLAVGGKRGEHDALEAQLGDALQLRNAFLRIDQRDVGRAVQAVGSVTAEVRDPVVVHAVVGQGEVGVGDFLLPQQADRGIQDRGVDAVRVKLFDARVRIVGALGAVHVAELLGERDFARLAERRGDPHAANHGRDLPVDLQAFPAFLVVAQTQSPVFVLRLQVLFPQIGRLQNVAVGVDDSPELHGASLLIGCQRSRGVEFLSRIAQR